MKNLLIIGPGMIPYTTEFGGCQRMYYLAEHLYSAGWNVHVLAIKQKKSKVLENEIHFKQYFIEKETDIISSCSNKFIKKVDKILYNEPIPFVGKRVEMCIIQNRDKIKNIILENNINIVIVSGPHFALFRSIKDIKKIKGDLKIVLDYRDPWNLWNKERAVAFYKEKRLIKRADRVVCFSKTFEKDMKRIFGYESKFSTIYNGYSEAVWSKINDKKCYKAINEKLVISYVGGICMDKGTFRDPNPLLNAFLKFENRNEIVLQFIGTDKIDIRMRSIENKSRGTISFIEKISPIQSMEYMLKSDILVVLHQSEDVSGKYIISGKFYDYIRSNKVIWNIGKEKDQMDRFIKKYRLGITCANDEKNILTAFDKFYKEWKNGTLSLLRLNNARNMFRYSREYQNEKYNTILTQLLNDK